MRMKRPIGGATGLLFSNTLMEKTGGSGNETEYDGGDKRHTDADKSRMHRISPVAW